MTYARILMTSLGVFLAIAQIGAARADSPATLPSTLTLTDAAGVVRRPLNIPRGRAAVIIFVATDCPVSNSYAPEINRLRGQYSEKADFYLVYSDARLTRTQIGKHAASFGYACPALLDDRRDLARALGATLTPEAAVVGTDGRLLYRGRIDDRYVTLGRQRFEPTSHDLRDALDAALSGREVPNPRTRAIGCTIELD